MPKLAFVMQTQLQTDWCWAAVSASTSSFFAGPPGPSGGPWKQCEVAQCALPGNPACCDQPMPASCNQDYYLENGLTCVNHLAGSPTAGTSPYLDVKNEIDNGHPVGVRIEWYGDGGHFVCLTGYDDSTGTQFVEVDDPYYGHSTYEYSAFCSAYQGGGSWTHTYPIA